MREVFDDFIRWQDETFPNKTTHSLMTHFKDEIVELEKEIESGEGLMKNKYLEFADCFLLLFALAESEGMDYPLIVKSIKDKMTINKTREWESPDKDGVCSHVRKAVAE